MLTQTRQRPQPGRTRGRPAPGAAPPPGSRSRGQRTARKLLAAALTEFGERGFPAVTVDHIVGRAQTSHGTFYLYFASKDHIFGVLAGEALRDMERLADEFPVVTPSAAGRAALRKWVSSFCRTYAAHGTVLKILSQPDLAEGDTWRAALTTLFHLADTLVLGMTAGMAGHGPGGTRRTAREARLDAVACLMMLERVNYLLTSGVDWDEAAVADQLTRIVFAAFQPGPELTPSRGAPGPVPAPRTGSHPLPRTPAAT